MLDPPFFGRSCRDCGPVSLGKTGEGGGVALSSRRTWPRWAAPPCRPTSASSPARPAPGRLWSVTEERKLGSNNNKKRHGASASVTGLDLVKQRPRIYVLMRTSHERKRKELHHSLCLWQHAEIVCVLAFSPFYLASPFLVCLAFVKSGSNAIQTGFPPPPPPLCSHLVSALSGRVCVRVTPTHMAKAF